MTVIQLRGWCSVSNGDSITGRWYSVSNNLRGDDGVVYQTPDDGQFGSPGVTILLHSTASEFINVYIIRKQSFYNMCFSGINLQSNDMK